MKSTTTDFVINEPVSKMFPICFVIQYFDFENYFKQTTLERKKILLDTIHSCVTAVCEKLDVDKTCFMSAYQRIKELNYTHKFFIEPLKFSKNKQYKAGVEIEINEDAAELYAVFTNDKDERISSFALAKTKPFSMFINRISLKGKWISNNEFTISHPNGQNNYKTSSNSIKNEFISTFSGIKFE